MKKNIAFAIWMGTLTFLPAAAAEAACPATTCDPHDQACLSCKCKDSEIGLTTLDYGKKNIIACLKDDSGASVWKAMSSSNNGATITKYNAGTWSLIYSNQSVDMGTHDFCALTQVYIYADNGPRWSQCQVTHNASNVWTLNSKQTGWPVACTAMCIN